MAYRDHPQIGLRAGDTVVFSATPIPGNERAVNETIDRLYHVGADVVTTRDAPIHASGHGFEEELKLMLNLTHPRYVMPVHGDYKRMLLHGQLAGPAGGARPRRAVPRRQLAVRRGAARGGRGLARPRSRAADHGDRGARGDAPRRPRGVHLRAAAAPPD